MSDIENLSSNRWCIYQSQWNNECTAIMVFHAKEGHFVMEWAEICGTIAISADLSEGVACWD